MKLKSVCALLAQRPLPSVFAAGMVGFISLGAHPALAGTVTLNGASGTSCTYTGMQTDSAGNVSVTCDGGSNPTPVNGVCGSASGGTFSTQPASNLCSVGSTSGTGGVPVAGGAGSLWTWTCGGVNGGSPSPQCSASYTEPPPPSGDCPAVPNNYLVVEEGASGYSSGPWAPRTNTLVGQLPVGAGIALAVPVDQTATGFFNGFKLSDGTAGSKAYVLSRCPGSSEPVAINGVLQNGSASVNSDTRADNCMLATMYGRWGDVGNFYANSTNLSRQYTCFLPPSVSTGKYYLNVVNTSSTTAVGFQIRLYPQLN